MEGLSESNYAHYYGKFRTNAPKIKVRVSSWLFLSRKFSLVKIFLCQFFGGFILIAFDIPKVWLHLILLFDIENNCYFLFFVSMRYRHKFTDNKFSSLRSFPRPRVLGVSLPAFIIRGWE